MSEIYTKERLAELQAMSLDEKIEITQDRIEDWYMQFQGNVYVSFSGGKDSTVLLHIVRGMFPEVPAVFVDTGLEYPEVRQNVREMPNVTILRPKMTFPEVIKTYGYPMVSKEVAEAIYYARRATKKISNRRIRLATRASNYQEQSIIQCSQETMSGGEITGKQTGDNGIFLGYKQKTPKRKQNELTGQRRVGGVWSKAATTRKSGSSWLSMLLLRSAITVAA